MIIFIMQGYRNAVFYKNYLKHWFALAIYNHRSQDLQCGEVVHQMNELESSSSHALSENNLTLVEKESNSLL